MPALRTHQIDERLHEATRLVGINELTSCFGAEFLPLAIKVESGELHTLRCLFPHSASIFLLPQLEECRRHWLANLLRSQTARAILGPMDEFHHVQRG